MKYYYSASTNGFYNEDIFGPRLIDGAPNPSCKIPADVVEITIDEHAALFEAQAAGKVIKADAQGKPIAVNYVPTTEEAKALLINQARRALEDTDLVFLRCGKAGVAWPTAWQTYVVALRAIASGTSSASQLPTVPAYPQGS